MRITRERLKQVEDYFAKHGGKTIIIGRFIGLVRALAPFIAGTSKMPYSNFAPYSIIGTGLWATTFILIGYFASQSLDKVAEHRRDGARSASASSSGSWSRSWSPFATCASESKPRSHRRRDGEAAGAAPRPGRGAEACSRRRSSSTSRLTPGGLGLELTTLMAIASVGLFVLIAYWSIVAGDPAPTGGDEAASDFATTSGWAGSTTLAKVVTVFGSGFVVLPLALAAAVWLGVDATLGGARGPGPRHR